MRVPASVLEPPEPVNRTEQKAAVASGSPQAACPQSGEPTRPGAVPLPALEQGQCAP